MGLPPVDVLLEPVTCMPAWVAKFAAMPTTIVASGCSEAGGNVQCAPQAMADAAARKLGIPISLEAYTLARYVQTEVGNKSVPERVAVLQDAINRARYIEAGLKGNTLNLLLYRQAVDGPYRAYRGYYGPIHGRVGTGVDVTTAPYGRWAATSRDPSIANIHLAIAVLNGEIPADFNKGADDQNGPEIFVNTYGLERTMNGVRSRGQQRRYWVGPLPGVDHMRTFQYRTLKNVDPASPLGRQLIERGAAAIAAGRPNWSTLPACPAGSGITAISPPGGVVAAVVGAIALAIGTVFGALALRRRRGGE